MLTVNSDKDIKNIIIINNYALFGIDKSHKSMQNILHVHCLPFETHFLNRSYPYFYLLIPFVKQLFI